MIKKTLFAAAVLGAAVTAVVSTSVLAGEVKRVETGAIAFDIPAEFADLVTVQTEGLPEGTLVRVSETASIDAAKAQGKDADAAGWLFDISCVTEDQLKDLRSGGMEGMEVFAEDDDIYYIYEHATDVRFVREQYDDIEEDQRLWTSLNEWAYNEVRDEILANNPELDAEVFTNTDLDINLDRAAYDPTTKYVIRSLDFGTLEPNAAVDADDYIESLAEDFIYELVDDENVVEGESIVLAFDEAGVRYEFYPYPGMEYYIRQVYAADDGEEYVTIFKGTPKEADEDDTPAWIMLEWCYALQNA